MSALAQATRPSTNGPSLPVRRSSARRAQGRPAPSPRAILLAEDDPVVRHVLKLVIEFYGDRVLEAEDGATAVALASTYQGHLDLLVTDIMMPGYNGAEVCQRVRADRPDLPTLFISGYYPEAVFSENGLPARSAFLAKPFMPEDFAEAVDRLLGTSPRSQATTVGS
jgi:CheY-like chemotaxis protein